MKKVFNKLVCAALLISIIVSGSAVMSGTAYAEAYTYEKEVTKNVSMNSEDWELTWDKYPDVTYNLETLNDGGESYLHASGSSEDNLAARLKCWEPKNLGLEKSAITEVTIVGKYTAGSAIPCAIDRDGCLVSVGFSLTSAKKRQIRQSTASSPSTGFIDLSDDGHGVKISQENKSEIAFPTEDGRIKSVFKNMKDLGTADSRYNGRQGVFAEIYQYVDGENDTLLFSFVILNGGSTTPCLYPAIGSLTKNLDDYIYSMSVKYTETVDADDIVNNALNNYPVYKSINTIADVTFNNAATLVNEINKFKAEYAEMNSQLQSILVSAGVYDINKLDAVYSVAENMLNGKISQNFDNDISSNKTIDDMWSAAKAVTVENGVLISKETFQKINLTNGLSTAPKSLVVKAQFGDKSTDTTDDETKDNTRTSAALRFDYDSDSTDGKSDYFWVQAQAYKSGDKLIAESNTMSEIKGFANWMQYDGTTTRGWRTEEINYPEKDDAIVIGTYDSEGNYTAKTLTFTVNYILSNDKYKFSITIADEEGHSVSADTRMFINADTADYSLAVSSNGILNTISDETNNDRFTTPDNKIESIEYLMPENGIVAPEVLGVKFKDPTNGNCDIAFNIKTNVSENSGYTPVSYGAVLIKNKGLVNTNDVISEEYVGNTVNPILAEKAFEEGSEVTSYLVSVAKSNQITDGVDARAVRFAARAFVRYQTSDGRLVTVYSRNNLTANDIALGQGNRSITKIAKLIAAHEIANMENYSGTDKTPADASTIASINEIIAAASTTKEQRDTLIDFVNQYKDFITKTD